MTNTFESTPRSILVTGDVFCDQYLYQGRKGKDGSQIKSETLLKPEDGGAALLFTLILGVAAKLKPAAEASFGFDVGTACDGAADGFCLMRPFKKWSKGDDEAATHKKEKVWRMSEALGFGRAAAPLNASAIKERELKSPHRVVVIEDAGFTFRSKNSDAAWPRIPVAEGPPHWFVLKTAPPFAKGDLWHSLVPHTTGTALRADSTSSNSRADRTVAIVSIEDVRSADALISKNLSWEQAAVDLATELKVNHKLQGLLRCRYVVVSFDTDGAMIVERCEAGDHRFHLIFDPSRLERDFDDAYDGRIVGFQACMTAAIAASLVDVNPTGASSLAAIKSGCVAGLRAMRRLLVEGHGLKDASSPSFPFAEIAAEIVQDGGRWSYGIVELPVEAERKTWTIVAGNDASPRFSAAQEVANKGIDALENTPFLKFGDLLSVERSEIESFRMLKGLMERYDRDRGATKPLSIAVFGAPGSGKSFGVRELAKAVFGDALALLEFNLSQFEHAHQLHGLFHQVRDNVLKGKTPVVFWDEFDSRNSNWLQNFLAPMQDGTFQAGEVTHPIGKSVFVFAGGTRERFDLFGKPLPRPHEPKDALEKEFWKANQQRWRTEDEQWEADFIAKKGPDFKSRLAGFLNIFGPNRQGPDDMTFPIRRALILRHKLGIEADQELLIDEGLLRAFLEIGRFNNGARSLEKIAEQIRQSHRPEKKFGRSDLPPRSLLELHVDAESFIKLVEGIR